MTNNIKKDLSLANYFSQFGKVLERTVITGATGNSLGIEPGISIVMEMLTKVRDNHGSVFVIGNGGSAGVASHAVIDFVNVARLRAFTLHDAALITCMANDYGYENAFARVLGQMAKKEDVLIAISSSGNSNNICNAAKLMADAGGKVITLSGFSEGNRLRSLGAVNIWLDSSNYGMVEIGHQFVLHNMADRFGAGY